MPEEKNQLEWILDEHRGCMAVLARLESCLDRIPEEIRNKRLLSQLRELDSALRQHFKGEESGFFSQLPLEQPRLATQFQKLEDEHPRILKSLESLMQEAERLEGDAEAGPPPQLRANVHRLILTLRRHEAEENELVMHAAWDTLGNID